MDKRFREMRYELVDMAKAEAYRLWRLARKANEHGCSNELVAAIREEANWLHTTGRSYPERLLGWQFQYEFKYAFKM